MNLEDLLMYHEDLIKMGFISEKMGEDGLASYKLTELGIKSGLESLPN